MEIRRTNIEFDKLEEKLKNKLFHVKVVDTFMYDEDPPRLAFQIVFQDGPLEGEDAEIEIVNDSDFN